jgi:8-oxo-dGTP pyrophosphatase MutT (NUDIX family)
MRKIKRDIVGAFIFSGDNKLLMGKKVDARLYPGTLIVPGGGVDSGESKPHALQRELMEEIGLDISNARVEQIEYVFESQTEKILRSGEKVLANFTFYNYKVYLPQPAAKITLKTDDDFIDAQWFELDELKKVELSPPTITTLTHLGYL